MTLFTTTSTMRYLMYVSRSTPRVTGSGELHVSTVELSGESLEVISGTKTGVQLSRILDPVTLWV